MRPPPLRCSGSCAAAALVDEAPLYKAARLGAGVEPWEDLQLVWGEVSVRREKAGVVGDGRVAMDADGEGTASAGRRDSVSVVRDGSPGDRDEVAPEVERRADGYAIHVVYVAEGQSPP